MIQNNTFNTEDKKEMEDLCVMDIESEYEYEYEEREEDSRMDNFLTPQQLKTIQQLVSLKSSLKIENENIRRENIKKEKMVSQLLQIAQQFNIKV
jgi:hypothetical protein